MGRKRSIDLTPAELRLMEVVWRNGKATAPEVIEALGESPAPAYNTVLTTMTILERKGYLRRTAAKVGRAFVFYPVVSRRQASGSAVRHLLKRFFGDSAEALMLNLIQNKKLSEAQLKRVRELLKEKPE